MSLTGQKVSQKGPPRVQDVNQADADRHIAFVEAKPCLICGRRPSEAHHVRLGLRTMGKRVCDSKTVPLCPDDHRLLHNSGEDKFWLNIYLRFAMDPFKIAAQIWHERTGAWPAWYDAD